MYNLINQVAVVTGGANGIGAALVREFLKENVKFVAVLDVDETSGVSLMNKIESIYGKDKASFFKCDVTKDDDLHSIFDEIAKRYGAIDIVVNNAGIADETHDMYKRQINTNFTAVVSCTLKSLELMRVDRGGKGGTVINISSTIALTRCSPMLFVYGATKSAVLHLSTCMGMVDYYKHTKVRIVTVCFGATETNMLKTAQSYDGLNEHAISDGQDLHRKTDTVQSAETAARGVVDSYKNGKTGSTWLVNRSKVYDISDNIAQAYDIMSKNAEY